MRLVLLLSVVVIATACDSGPYCDPGALESALSGATDGTVVQVGACRVEGNFTVPAGVTLEGTGPDSGITGAPGGSALTLDAGSGATRIRGLAITSAEGFGILAVGVASVTIEDCTVTPSTGVAIALEDATSAALRRVSAVGTYGPGDPIPMTLDVDNAALRGIVMNRVADAMLEDVTVTGFGDMGVQLVWSDVTWNRGGIDASVFLGVVVAAGRATFVDVELTRTRADIRESFAGLFVAGAVVESENLLVENNERFGIVHVQSTGHHRNAVVRGNGLAGILMEQSDAVCVDGEDTVVGGNAYAGVLVRDSADVEVMDAEITTTERELRVFEDFTMAEVGDGVLALGASPNLLVRAVSIQDNERAGISVDLALGMTAPTFENVTVAASGDAVGAVAGEVTDMGGRMVLMPTMSAWDTGITRMGAAVDNDPAFVARGGPAMGTHDMVGIVTPSMFPISELTGAGVRGIVTPSM